MFPGHKIRLMEKDCIISNRNKVRYHYLHILHKLKYVVKERDFPPAIGNTKH